jgi:hypothetical protein
MQRSRLILAGILSVTAVRFLSMSLPAQEADATAVTLAGTLLDHAGQPLSGATLKVIDVWKLDRGNRERAAGGGSGTSDAEGRVRIDGIPRGRIISLRFSHPDYPRFWFEATTVHAPVLARKTTRWEILANHFQIALPRPRKVQVRLSGNDGRSPLAGVVIEARPTSDSEQIHVGNEWSARGVTDAEGSVTFTLSEGRFDLRLEAERPLDGIALNEPRITVRDAGHLQTFLRMIRRGADVVFRAVDFDTGAPIPGVSFWREMPEGEYWFEVVHNETIGSRATEISDKAGREPPYVTDDRGTYRCQMQPARGWTYHVHHLPPGYEEVDSRGQTFDIPGEGLLEKTFQLRKKAEK